MLVALSKQSTICELNVYQTTAITHDSLSNNPFVNIRTCNEQEGYYRQQEERETMLDIIKAEYLRLEKLIGSD